jgi:hypothetical protein
MRDTDDPFDDDVKDYVYIINFLLHLNLPGYVDKLTNRLMDIKQRLKGNLDNEYYEEFKS